MSTTKNKPTSPVILQILPALNGGGVERGTLEMSKALTAKGWTSLIASSGGRMVPDLVKDGSIHFTLPLASKNPLVIKKNINRLVGIIKENHVDIVHARSRAPAWSAYFAAKKAGVKFITTVHGTYGLGPFGLKKLYNRIMLAGDLVITVSEFVAHLLIKEYGADKSKLRVVHRGVDTDLFDPAKVSFAAVEGLKKDWGLPKDKAIIMMPCRLSRWKGHHLMIDALDKLKNKDDLLCLFIGALSSRDNYKKEIEKYAASKGLRKHVKIISYCADMPAAYLLADIVISAATKPEAFGRTIIEAEAMERVVVAADEGGACETIKNGLTGFLFTSRDSEDLADTLEKIFDLSEREKEVITTTARNCTINEFSVSAMCAKTIKVYEELL